MFAMTSSAVNSQIAFQICNLSQLSFYRPATKTNNLYSRNRDKRHACTNQLHNSEDRTITELCLRLQLNRSDKNITKILQECTLGGLSNQTVAFTQTRKYSHLLANRNIWYESHKSHHTFEENKAEVLPKKFNLSRKWTEASPLLLVARSFKTKRATRTFEPQSSFFQNSFDSKYPSSNLSGEQNQKLSSLLENEPSEEFQKKIKIAFAQGYILGGENKSVNMKYQAIARNIFMFVVPMVVVLFFARKLKLISVQMNVTNKEVNPSEINVTFEDVQGAEEAKQELLEVVNFLKNPDKYTTLGAELPKGVLLVGPPGTGKTLLARAVAGEAKVPFFHAAGAEFDEVLVGQGARRVRELFQSAKQKAPCVIFIDEVDSVGAKRTSSVLHPYANQTINQLLAEMDGFVKNEGVIVLGATNRRENLDKALLRPGRFDVEIQVPVPDLAERKHLFQYYLGKVKLGRDVDSEVLARGSTGFTGADIKNVVNQAALRAATDAVDNVSMMYLEEARDKVLMGPEKKSRIPDEDANLITAYHEGGHTLVSFFTKDSVPLHKVTIIRRGPALGHTAFIPEKEQYHMTKSQMLAMMDSLMGGRAAEEVIFGNEKLTTGASSDLQRATSIAEMMVKGYGMSDKVGLRAFREPSDDLISVSDNLSVTTKESIDSEIKNILQESYERAKSLLKAHAKEHKALAEALMKYETLDSNDIKIILEGRPLSKII